MISGAAIGVGERQEFEVRWQLFDREAEIVHFFAAISGAPAIKRALSPRTCGNAIHDRMSGVGFGREHEEDFVVLVIEFGERGEVAFKPGSNPLQEQSTAVRGA